MKYPESKPKKPASLKDEFDSPEDLNSVEEMDSYIKEPFELILDRPIFFYPVLFKWTQSIPAALILTQVIHWTRKLSKERDGWFYKTREQWEQETKLSPRQQRLGRKKLRKLGFLEEKFVGAPPKIWFHLGSRLQNLTLQMQPLQPLPRVTDIGDSRSRFYAHAHTKKQTTQTTNSLALAREGGIKEILGQGEGKLYQACKDFRQLVKKRTGKFYPDHILQKRWITLATSFVQDQLQGNQDHFLKVLDWYVKNIDGAYITECTSLPGFCEKFRQIEKARSRQAQSNGDSNPGETHNIVIIREHNPNLKDTW